MKQPRLEQALSDGNLFAAWAKVRGNAGCAGVDGQTIEDFEERLLSNLELLRSEVRQGTYRPRPLLRVVIEEQGNKSRPLSIPTVRDRTLQSAVSRVLTPVFEMEFEACSFAYRKGRSVDQAVRRVERLRELGFKWVVDADVRAFFDEIDHALMMEFVQELVTDPDILALVRAWLKAKVRDGKSTTRISRGVPQGSPISPLLANLYLDHFDEVLLDRNLRLVRFADDFLILCKSRDKAQHALEITREALAALKLCVNENKTRVVDFNSGFKFLGYQFVRSLVIKSTTTDIPPRAERRRSEPVPQADQEEAEADPEQATRTAMQKAFSEVGLSLTDFVAAGGDDPEPLPPPAPEPSLAGDPRLRTLYLLEHGCTLAKESERLLVRRGTETVREIPAIKVDQILVFGNVRITTPAMKFCLREKIPIVLLSSGGWFYGVIDGFSTDPVMLHREQFVRAEDPVFCLELAREMIRGKLANSRLILMRYARHRGSTEVRDAAQAIQQASRRLRAAESLEQIRGFEGSGAKVYFEALSFLLDRTWGFERRQRRPPPDPVNALLSYGYSLLFYNIYALIRARGLNPHVGYLHPLRAGHPALVSDLMEEFRAIVVDAVVLNMVLNQKLTSEQDFAYPEGEGEGCLIRNTARKKFISAFEAKMNSPLTHPVSGLRLDYRRCIEHQISSVARLIQGKQDRYQALTPR